MGTSATLEISKSKLLGCFFAICVLFSQTVFARADDMTMDMPNDQDGDGVEHCQDACPGIQGPDSNNGCPECSVWEIAAITLAIVAALSATAGFATSQGTLVRVAAVFAVSTITLSAWLAAASAMAVLSAGYAGFVSYVCNNG